MANKNRKQDIPLNDRRYQAHVKGNTGVKTDGFRTRKKTAYVTKANDYEHMKKYLRGNTEKETRLSTMKKGSCVKLKTTERKGSSKSVSKVKIVRTQNLKPCENCNKCQKVIWKKV